MKAAVIADDLTGAQEAGALLAARHFRTLVTTSWEQRPRDADAVVVDTESRNLTPDEAAHRMRTVAELLTAADPCVALFKKVDSTLRGPIAAELLALSCSLGGRPIVFTPAYPQQGRVVRHGRLFVNGIEVSETEFARDPRWPVTDSRPAHLFETEAGAERIHICDAESDADLRSIVERAPAGAILAGSGGLGRAWADSLPSPNSTPSRKLPPPQTPLLVCGSHHPVSLHQAQRASGGGMQVILPPEGWEDPEAVLGQLAAAAHEAMESLLPDMLILFGGETAAAVLSRAGVSELWPVCELAPGVVAAGARHGNREIIVVTKAGGFGEPSVVEHILRKLQ